jgi:putative ABC transport system permease protein
VLGLSIGIGCSLLIALYVINEAGYDRFNVKSERIFRVILDGKIGGEEITWAKTAPPLGPTLLKEFPEVEDYLRMDDMGPVIVEYNKQSFIDNDIIQADSTFFNFFSIPVIAGDQGSLLNAPHKVVLSKSMATKIFGNENPIDKNLKIGTDTVRYTVSGVMDDVPEKSHFRASMIVAFMTFPRSKGQSWGGANLSTYILLKPNAGYETVNDKFDALIMKYYVPEVQKYMHISLEDYMAQGNKYRFYLQNLKGIHLDPSIMQVFKPASDPKYLVIFGSIAVLIVVIAAINFMNLSTAQASRRFKEVGIKKIIGSTRGMLVTQFLSESFILSFFALVLALVFILYTLPYFNSLLGTRLKLELFEDWYAIPVLILFTIFVGIMAGSYSAFYLSSFNPYEVLKGIRRNSGKNNRLRRILVVFQFAISILLIVGSITMYRQIKYMLSKDVGFNKEQLLVLERADALGTKLKSFKETVKTFPGVINIASSTSVPGRTYNHDSYMMEGRKDEFLIMQTSYVDYNYLDTYGMTLVSGRFFNESYPSDKEGCLVNESAVINFSISDPEKTRIIEGNKYLPILGVVRNFNFESLQNPIQPYIFKLENENTMWGYITVKLSALNYSTTISAIEAAWKEYSGNSPMQYFFVNEDFERMYKQENQNAKLAVIFATLAIFIASLGLFGLTSYTVEQRTKEIGVRKAMGSSVIGIYLEISKEIIVLVSISALIAWPMIYYIAGRWLENFYYRISPGVFSFIAGFAIALGIAIFTISIRVIKAARMNPARSLKYE